MIKHQTYKPKTLTEREVITVFPEARTIVPEQLREWKQKRGTAKRIIKELFDVAKTIFLPDTRFVVEEYLKQAVAPHVRLINGHIYRLDRLHNLITGTPQRGQVGDEEIERARNVPMINLVTIPLRKAGRTYSGQCPLHDHDDHNPSFHVYPDTNSWYCFGCSRGGDVIAFVIIVHALSFLEAIHYLNNYG